MLLLLTYLRSGRCCPEVGPGHPAQGESFNKPPPQSEPGASEDTGWGSQGRSQAPAHQGAEGSWGEGTQSLPLCAEWKCHMKELLGGCGVQAREETRLGALAVYQEHCNSLNCMLD